MKLALTTDTFAELLVQLVELITQQTHYDVVHCLRKQEHYIYRFIVMRNERNTQCHIDNDDKKNFDEKRILMFDWNKQCSSLLEETPMKPRVVAPA